MKYKNMFKKWYFWLIVVIDFILNATVSGYVHWAEYVGGFVGAFLLIFVLGSLSYLLTKGIKKIRRRNS